MTFHLPSTIALIPFENPEDDESLDDAKWYFYRFVDDQCPAWPSLLATTNREKSKLIDIIQDVVTMMYGRQSPGIDASQILQQYSRYATWRRELPSVIGNIENNTGQALPHVLCLLSVLPLFT